MKLSRINTKNNTRIFTADSDEINKVVEKLNSRPYHMLFRNITDYFGRKDSKLRDKYYREQRKAKNDDIRTEKKYPGWHFIPLETYRVIQQLKFAKEYAARTRTDNEVKNNRFLDAGCGPGNIIMLAKDMGMSYYGSHHGIELDKEAADLGRILTGSFRSAKESIRGIYNGAFTHIFNGDIVTFKYYKRYGIIYYYCPIKLHPLQVLFEERLEDSVLKNTILIPNLKQSGIISNDDRFLTVKCVNSNGSRVCDLLVKTKMRPRKQTQLQEEQIKDIPEKYQAMAYRHLKTVERNNAKRVRTK